MMETVADGKQRRMPKEKKKEKKKKGRAREKKEKERERERCEAVQIMQTVDCFTTLPRRVHSAGAAL